MNVEQDEKVSDKTVDQNGSTTIEVQFTSLINSLKDIVIFKDGSGRWVTVNDFGMEVFGLKDVPGGYKGKTDGEIAQHSPVLAELLDSCTRSDELAWASGDSLSEHQYISDASKNIRVYEVTKIPKYTAEGKRKQLVVIGRDVTPRMEAEQRHRDREKMYRSLFDNHPDPVFILDTEGRFTDINPAAAPYLDDLRGLSYRDLILRRYLTMATENFEATLRGETRTYEISIVDKSQRIRRTQITNIPMVIDGRVSGVFGIAKDMTEAVEAQQKIRTLAYVDDLTGLPNRRAFRNRFGVEMDEARTKLQPLGIMRLDLDGFRHINDTYSHLVGDDVLRSVAARIRSVISSEMFVSRDGGDEFTVIAPDLRNIAELTNTADAVIEALKHPFQLDKNEFYISTSIGLSTFPESGTRGRDLVKSADIALNRAKENGKNQWWFSDPTLNVETYRQFMLKNDLHKAVDNGELVIHYQPKVNPVSHRIVGVEALVRWEHADWGLVSPSDFIPLAEETGVIHDVGDWVFKTVCEQVKVWADTGVPTPSVSVNVSARQFSRNSFVDKVRRIVTETGVDAHFLEIELTESAIIYNEDLVAKSIRELHDMGIRVAVDDFGTGYSSLGQLKRFEFDALKIDKSFVEDVSIDPDAVKLVRSVIQMAHGLGLDVVVEGVETSKQADLLRKSSADEFQGYLFSKPVPVSELERLLQAEILHPSERRVEAENRRHFYRIAMEYPLIGSMTIDSINGSQVELGTTEVLVQDIGPGGLRFMSHIRMPVSNNIVLRFRLVIYEELKLLGYIVWSNEFKHERYEYGVEFSLTESERDDLTQLLNQLSVQLRHQAIIPNCRMLVDSTRNFFNEVKNASGH